MFTTKIRRVGFGPLSYTTRVEVTLPECESLSVPVSQDHEKGPSRSIREILPHTRSSFTINPFPVSRGYVLKLFEH